MIMNKEDIEKEAADSYIDMCTVKDNWDEEMYSDGFIDGANWRINSVWHDASDKPKENMLCLVKLASEDKLCFKVRKYNIIQIKKWEGKDGFIDIVKWAYIEDLLPERKEEAE